MMINWPSKEKKNNNKFWWERWSKKKNVQREGKRERETKNECVYFKVNIHISYKTEIYRERENKKK